ncbi:T9SS type B sorting domain-containing protein [Flavobacterium psychrotrophum]|uniref:T9SS type B sorting domain-containing protein n=1 Tax=Flavobacterium psychrotrophum TaxID=2294119 RepID=UPI0013C4DD55|nr:T9SS type B sorting domain-containing protein [Flavobacterium psychrotrophum]
MFKSLKRSKALSIILLFCAGSVFSQSPGGVNAGLTGWFRSTSSAGTATTDPVLLNNTADNRVRSWTSSGGTNAGTYALTQTTTSRMPVYTPTNTPIANFNFNPFIQFSSGNNTMLSNTDGTAADLMATQGSAFVVVNTYANINPKNTALTYSRSNRWQFKPSFRTQSGNGVSGSTGDYYNAAPYPGGQNTTSYPETAGIILLGKGISTSTTSNEFSAKRNGDIANITNRFDPVYNPSVSAGFFVGSNNGSELFSGGVAEVITYNVNLSDADVNKVESYLAVKYGVTLTTGQSSTNWNYTAPNGSIFWATDNAFKFNVTGIGRDDVSGLYQKQSKSVHNNNLITVYNKSAAGVFPLSNAINSTTIDASASYFMTADDGMGNNVLLGECVNRIARTWKVQKTGSITDVTIAAAKAELPANTKYLVVSSTPAFLANDITIYDLDDTGTILYKNVNIPTGYYFTFGLEHTVMAVPTTVGCGTTYTTLGATGIGTWTADSSNPGTSIITSPLTNGTQIHGFTVPGVYKYNWGTPTCFKSISITFTGAEPPSPTVTDITYCQHQTAVPLTASVDAGNTLVWYDVAGNSYPSITPDTSLAGTFTYYVEQQNALGCPSVPAPLVVTVGTGQAPVTGFTLPSNACVSATADVLPTPATGFTTGGTFTAGTGLTINATTGAITPSTSTPGSYTVTYTIAPDPGNCIIGGTDSATITIDAAPALTAPAAQTLCDDDYDGIAVFNLTTAATQALNGQTGYTVSYHSSLNGAQTNTDVITPSAPGAYPSATQTVYIRVIDAANSTNCYGVTQVQLTVNPRPAIPVIQNYVLCDDPATTGNVATFDLTTKDAEATAGVSGLTVSYYASQPDAEAGTTPLVGTATYNNTSSPQIVWVRVQNAQGCYSTGSFSLIVNPLPVVNPATTPYSLCDDGTGRATFTLSAKNNEITNNNTGYTVRYYATQLLAEGGATGTELANSYYSATTTIYARVQDATTNCYVVTPLQLQALSSPTLSPVAGLDVCEDGRTGSGTFNLIPAGAAVVNNQAGYTATFYTSQAFADAGGTAGQISSPGTYSSTGGTVYIRVVATGVTGNCYSVGQVILTVNPRPVINPIQDIVLCDDTAPALDGKEVFDLTSRNTQATSDPTDVVTYYRSNSDAQLDQNAIISPASYQNETRDRQQVWVRVETIHGCYDVGSFTLIVNPLPLADLSSPIFYACEETPGEGLFYFDRLDPVMMGGQAGYTALYYENQADAVPGNANFITVNPYLSVNKTIYALVTNTATGCSVVAPAQLEVQPAPIAPNPTDLEECDFNNDNVTTFNLQDALDEIQAAMGGTVTLTIHETSADANYQNGTNPITTHLNDYTNIEAQTTGGIQTLYIRVNSATTSCFDVVPLRLVVHPVPEATDPLEDYALCDNGASDTDGQAIFDLTSYQAIVLNTMNPAQFTVTYHTGLSSAQLGTPAIATPGTHTSATATVYIRVTNNATGCYDIVPLNLVVNPLPVVTNPTPLVLCDEHNSGDEVEEFDLTAKTDEITGGVNGLTTTFHTNLADAESGTGAIPNPETYENTGSPAVQPIFVRVTDNVTGCYRIVLLDIRVEPLPVLVSPTLDELTICDTNGSGYGNIDLDALVANMVNNGVGLTVAFYRTQDDAERGNNPILNTSDYENVTPGSQVLYVVATNTVTGCRSIVYPITIIITRAPIAVTLTDLTDCDDEDSDNTDHRRVFDLTQKDAEVYTQTGVAPGSYTIEYFTSEVNAQAGAPRITTPQSYRGTDGEQVWVRVSVPGTDCYQVSSFELHVNAPQELATPTVLMLCDEALPNDGKTAFDLTAMNDYILTPTGIGESNIVEYFEDSAYTSLISPASAYTNTSNPQTVFVRVTTPQGCESYSSVTLRVVPRPTPNIAPTPLELCDTNDANLGDGIEVFNLDLAKRNILGGDTQSQVAYYTTEAAAEAGDITAAEYIGTPTAYTSVTPWNDTVYVRVTRTDTQPGAPGCAEVVALPLIVNPLPPVYDSTGVVPLYAICNDPTTGFETFNLIGHITDLLTTAGVNPTDYAIRFYKDMAAYTAGTALPHNYTNVTAGHQQILVHVTDNTTRCEILTTLELYAEQAAVANPVTSPANSPMVECDYDGTNDGFTAFDLTPAGAEVLGTQNPAQYTLGYYTSQAAAEAGDITAAEYIATPAAFTNTVYLGQTIWVRVTNTSTFSPCYAVTSFNIRVSLLPTPNITSEDNDDTLCVEYSSGNVNKPVYLHAGDTTAGNTYQWYLNGTAVTTNGTSERYTATEEGLYTVEVWNADSCISDAVAPFEVFLSGPAEIINTGYVVSNAFGDNQTVTVLVQGYGDYQYSLAPEDADGNATPLGPWQNSNVFTNVPLGFFTVYVRDANTLEINPCDMLRIPGVSVVDYPKYFTPNGDGINDYWNIIGLQGTGARIFIFDRYGKLIKQLSPDSRTDKGQGWDGTYNGNPLPSDDYWFTVEFNENGHARTFKAHFAMKR